MRIDRIVTRKELKHLLAFLDSNRNVPTGEMFGHPKPKLIYCHTEHQPADRTDRFVQLYAIIPATSRFSGGAGINAFHVTIYIYEKVWIVYGGLSTQQGTFDTPESITQFVMSLGTEVLMKQRGRQGKQRKVRGLKTAHLG